MTQINTPTGPMSAGQFSAQPAKDQLVQMRDGLRLVESAMNDNPDAGDLNDATAYFGQTSDDMTRIAGEQSATFGPDLTAAMTTGASEIGGAAIKGAAMLSSPFFADGGTPAPMYASTAHEGAALIDEAIKVLP